MDRPQLVALLQENHDRFEQAVRNVRSEYLTEPLPGDERSVKDILAHLTAWEQRLLRWLRELESGEKTISEQPRTYADMDRLNEETLRQSQVQSFDDVLVAWQNSFQELCHQIEAFSDADLFEAGRFAELTNEQSSYALWGRIVAGPGCCHYHDHFYDLLIRTAPEQHFTPTSAHLATLAGVYISDRQQKLIFHTNHDCLLLNNAVRRGQQLAELPGLAVDDWRFAYKDFGLVTFQPAKDGVVSAVEWWNEMFTRDEGE